MSDLPVLVRQLQGIAPVFVGSGGTAPAYAAGWASYALRSGAHFWRMGQTMFLGGMVTKTGGTPAAGDPIFTLPFPPLTVETFVVASGETFTPARVDISAAGVVSWASGATGETDFTSLAGIHFWTGS